MAKSEKIPLDEGMVNIVGQCGPALLEALQSKFGCTAVFHGVDVVASGAGPSRKRLVPAEERFSIQLSQSLKVSVWKDDLTTHKVDAVVNAANENLQHGGGLARALCDAGGPDVQRESNRHIQAYGKLKTGDAIVTEPGFLCCKKIIHAVGPELPYYPTPDIVKQASPYLRMAVKNILKRVEEEKLQSVAIPALSSGLFNFPLPQCADIIVTTLKKYEEQRGYVEAKPLEVRLVNNDEPSVTEMTRACHQILASYHTRLNSAQGQGKGSNLYSQAARSHGENFTKPQISTVQIGNVNLTLKTGKIEKETVDVIVNTASERLQLSIGEISKAISQAAGRQMQDDIKHNAHVTAGEVFVTKGYMLNAKEVYHTVCVPSGDFLAKKVLEGVIMKCLMMASKSKHSSISFPAIGTGNLGFQKQEVANIMTRALADFANKFQGKRMDVYFVIYPTDLSTLKAFEEKLRYLQDTGKQSGSTKTATQGFEYTDRDRDSRAITPHIELSSASVETLKEAERWIQGVLSPPAHLSIQNNFIMHFGQREHEELLSLQAKWRVSIDVVFQSNRAQLIINGERRGISGTVLELEALCCKVQEEFAKEEESLTMALLQSTSSNHPYHRKPVDKSHSEYKNWLYLFRDFKILRVERVENQHLKQLFDLKKQQLQISGSGQTMFQRLPAQFCDLVCRVGCQREYAPPVDQKYGEGIYFSASVSGALQLWKEMAEEEYLYFIEAQVLTGSSTRGSPDLIVPPSHGSDPFALYDSVTGGKDTCVIFNGHQALPEYLVICKRLSISV